MSTFAENPYFFAGLFGTFFCLLIGLIFLDTPGDFADESDEEEGEEKQKNKKDNKQGQSQKKTNNSKKAKKD